MDVMRLRRQIIPASICLWLLAIVFLEENEGEKSLKNFSIDVYMPGGD